MDHLSLKQKMHLQKYYEDTIKYIPTSTTTIEWKSKDLFEDMIKKNREPVRADLIDETCLLKKKD